LVRCALALNSKKGRDKNDAFLIEGFILIDEALRAGLEIEQIFVRGGAEPSAAGSETAAWLASAEGCCEDICSKVAEPLKTARPIALAENIFDEIAGTVTPQGVMAVVKKPRAAGLEEVLFHASSILVMDRIQDPGNAGTLIRTAFASGIAAVVCVNGTVDIFSPKVVRSAAGAIFRMPIVPQVGAAEIIAALSDAGFSLKAMDMRGGKAYSDADLTGRVAIAVGNESGGLSAEFAAAADEIVNIPMRDGAESLNAAIAAGIVMYERNRQEKQVQGEA
jgi:TrmH family RNA methyltransferase